jgi:hypothetical protein
VPARRPRLPQFLALSIQALGPSLPGSIRHNTAFYDRLTVLWHTERMDEDQLFLPPCTKPPPGGISEAEYQCAEDMAFIKAQLSRLPTRRELTRFRVWVALGLCVLALIGLRMWLNWVWACGPF